MFERFTDRARRVLVLAQEEARQLNHNYIGTEHLLLALLREDLLREGPAPDTASATALCTAVQALNTVGVTYNDARSKIEWLLGKGRATPEGHITFTPRAKKVIEQSLREALQLGHSNIGTEHILLAIIRDTDGIAARLLLGYKVTPKLIRATLFKAIPTEGDPFKTTPTDSVTSDSDRLDTIIGLLEDITKKLDPQS